MSWIWKVQSYRAGIQHPIRNTTGGKEEALLHPIPFSGSCLIFVCLLPQYHDHPGTPFAGTNRTAYLPNNEEGCHLLTRLKYAWNRGLIFTVGTSLTTQQRNVVTWASIPHKTSLQRGGTAYGAQSNPHAFPDPNYLTNCHDTLDAHGVPDADTCLSMLS